MIPTPRLVCFSFPLATSCNIFCTQTISSWWEVTHSRCYIPIKSGFRHLCIHKFTICFCRRCWNGRDALCKVNTFPSDQRKNPKATSHKSTSHKSQVRRRFPFVSCLRRIKCKLSSNSLGSFSSRFFAWCWSGKYVRLSVLRIGKGTHGQKKLIHATNPVVSYDVWRRER